jgi:hypothetical protein
MRLYDNDENIAAFGWVAKDSGVDGITNQRKEYDSSMDARAEIVTETKMNEGRYSYTFVCGLCKKHFTFSDGRLDGDLNPVPPKYCPLCGSKVVN